MPRWVNELRHRTVTAEGAISENLGVIHGTADGQGKLPGASDAGAITIIGIATHDAADGKSVDLAVEGDVLVLVNGASVNIARGDKLKIAATTGRFVKAATDNDYYFLEANQAATTDGVLISATITRGYLGA